MRPTEPESTGTPPSLFLRRPDLAGLPPLELPEGYTLRPAVDADADALADLLHAAFPEMEWTPALARERLLDDATVRTVFLIVHDGVPVATASVRLLSYAYPGSGYIHWVGASPLHRGKRLGYLVSLATLHEFARLGCRDAILETDDWRLPALKVYFALGFRPEHRHPTHAARWENLKESLAQYFTS